MAVRLGLEFSGATFDSRVVEMEQVARHMRICLTATAEFETVVTIAPSEPLLAEGAYLMRHQADFDLPATLLKELESPELQIGNRGVLVCLVLLTLARDAVASKEWSAAISLLDFIRSLLAHDWHEDVLSAKPAKSRCPEECEQSLEETFARSRIYFDHFIKADDYKFINRKLLWALKARGAAIFCANNQLDVDVVLPFVYNNATLKRDNISAILIQVKTDKRFSASPNLFLFGAMDLCFLGFFAADEAEPLPIIRMVVALGSSDAEVEVLENVTSTWRRNPPQSIKGKRIAAKTSPPFTAYDIWCAAASRHTFAVISPAEEKCGVYQSLARFFHVCTKWTEVCSLLWLTDEI